MNKLSLMDIKSALWDKRFRDLFPDYADKIGKFLKDPGCACNITLLREIQKHKDRLEKYFPTKQVQTPEEEEEELGKNDWDVINCSIEELQNKISAIPKTHRVVAIARFKNDATVIVNDSNAESYFPSKKENKWEVINTDIYNLKSELRKLSNGRKYIQISRYEDQITVIANNFNH